MEQKLVRVPFDVESAKKITSGEMEGRIVTRKGYPAQILTFDMANRGYPICAKVLISTDEDCYHFAANGAHYKKFNPPSDFDLMLEIPEYMTFKDGDVVVTDNIIVVIRNPKMDDLNGFCFRLYVAYNFKEKSLFYCADFINQESVRLATEEEKQIFIEKLKSSKQPKDKEYLKRFFGIEEKKEYEFKPFDKVLVRDGNDGCWHADIFSHKNKDRGRYYCTGYEWSQCIPYNEQTAHLLGTTEDFKL